MCSGPGARHRLRATQSGTRPPLTLTAAAASLQQQPPPPPHSTLRQSGARLVLRSGSSGACARPCRGHVGAPLAGTGGGAGVPGPGGACRR